MGSERSRRTLEEVAELLGVAVAEGRALPGAGLDAIRKRTRKQLLEAAKKLELTGVSKLQKEQLARRVLEALKARVREEAPEVVPKAEGAARPAQPTKAPARPRGSVPATTSRAGSEAAVRRRENGTGASEWPSEVAAAPQADQEPAARAKLDLGPGARVEKPVEHIPWSYGMDRVTAAAVDPDRLYVHWEVTDPAIERARAGLGPGGRDAWLSLRVYDTTGLIFDGTNAHGYFDHRVERSDRQWFFAVGKPSSTAFVEIGMRSAEGYFVKIARSARVDFPRKEPAPWREPEWMTVLAAGEVRHAGTGVPSQLAATGAPAGGQGPRPFTPIPLWVLRESTGLEAHIRELLEGGWERVEWHEVTGEGWFELEGRVEWQGPLTMTTWEAGPFTYPVEIEPPLRQEWQGRSFAFKVGDVTHVVYGPWQVVIRNLGAHSARSVVGRWEVYRSWVAEGGREVRVVARAASASRAGASELVGASERLWLAASELRLGGASEFWRIGASEVRLRGASERLFVGASQWMLAGASERRLLGASEQRMRGASERFLGGASERLLAGASERQLGGASERLGASERHLGASEQRFEGGSAAPLPHPSAEGSYPVVE